MQALTRSTEGMGATVFPEVLAKTKTTVGTTTADGRDVINIGFGHRGIQTAGDIEIIGSGAI